MSVTAKTVNTAHLTHVTMEMMKNDSGITMDPQQTRQR